MHFVFNSIRKSVCWLISVNEDYYCSLQCLKGQVFVQHNVAYVPQQPWILNDTVRRNIVFQSPYDPERYQRTVAACALETDILQFAGGDDAEIVCLLNDCFIISEYFNDDDAQTTHSLIM